MAYVFQPFPKCKYHPDGRCVVVADPREELALGPGWRDKPAEPGENVPAVEAPPAPAPANVAPTELRRPRGRPRKG